MWNQAWSNLNLKWSRSKTGSGLFQALHVHLFSAEWVIWKKLFKGAVQTLVLPVTMKAIIVFVCKCILTDTCNHYCHFVCVYVFACLFVCFSFQVFFSQTKWPASLMVRLGSERFLWTFAWHSSWIMSGSFYWFCRYFSWEDIYQQQSCVGGQWAYL